ncbi:hypothetical protein SCO70_02835 [Legionella pneumophila serogroup 3]
MADETVDKEELYNYVKNHYWAVYRNSSTILSSTCRQLALALGGLCWLIKSNPDYKVVTCQSNLILVFLVMFFIFDALQYLISSMSYQKLAKKYDNKITNSKLTSISELIEPSDINHLPMICFSLKLFFLIFSSVVFIWVLLKI